MGMYTGLRGSVTFKESIADVMKEHMNTETLWQNCSLWVYVVDQTGLDLKDYQQDARCDFIPKGMVSYMPNDWSDNDFYWVGNTLFFTCSLKNYTGTIEHFISILPIVAVSWDLEELYEEDSEPTKHKHTMKVPPLVI
jgi:hypothetical protein